MKTLQIFFKGFMKIRKIEICQDEITVSKGMEELCDRDTSCKMPLGIQVITVGSYRAVFH